MKRHRPAKQIVADLRSTLKRLEDGEARNPADPTADAIPGDARSQLAALERYLAMPPGTERDAYLAGWVRRNEGWVTRALAEWVAMLGDREAGGVG